MFPVLRIGRRAPFPDMARPTQMQRAITGLFVLVLATLTIQPGQALTVTASTLPGLSYHYTTMFGSLNYLATGFPVTRDACRNSISGQRCSINGGTTGSIAQFDTGLGTLTQVDLAFSIAHTYQVVVGDFDFFLQTGQVTVNDVGSGSRVGFTQVTNAALGLNHFVGNLPEGSASAFLGHSRSTSRFGPGLRAEAFSLQYTSAADLALFEGLGSVDFGFASTGFQTVTDHNDLTLRGVSISPVHPGWRVSEHTRTFFPIITATYTYEQAVVDPPGPGPVADIPEPSSWAVFFGGMTGMCWLIRRRKKKAT